MIEAFPWHYDGRTGKRRQPRLIGDGKAFRLIDEDRDAGPYDWADIIAIDREGGERVFGHRLSQGWRMGFSGAIPSDIAALLPGERRYGWFIDRLGLGFSAVLLGCLSATLIYLAMRAPAWVAPIVPQSWEDRMGDAMVGDFGGRYCHTPAGDAALKALGARVDPAHHARSLEVANIAMANAIALPGRHVIIFDGLLQQADSPDEVAGVLAHELGHVENRDTLTAIIRQMGLSVILSGVEGGNNRLNALLGVRFSREAEHQADLFALKRIETANFSPRGAAGFFRKIDVLVQASQSKNGQAARADGEKPDGHDGKGKYVAAVKEKAREAANWFASHPPSHSRYELFASAARQDHAYRPALDDEQWKALKAMCAADPSVKSGSGM